MTTDLGSKYGSNPSGPFAGETTASTSAIDPIGMSVNTVPEQGSSSCSTSVVLSGSLPAYRVVSGSIKLLKPHKLVIDCCRCVDADIRWEFFRRVGEKLA